MSWGVWVIVGMVAGAVLAISSSSFILAWIERDRERDDHEARERADYMASKEDSVDAASIAFGCMLLISIGAAIWAIV